MPFYDIIHNDVMIIQGNATGYVHADQTFVLILDVYAVLWIRRRSSFAVTVHRPH